MAVKEAVTHKRAKVGEPVEFGDGFRVCRADAETGHKCHRRQGRSPRQVADGQRSRREMRVFQPQVQQSLITTESTTLMRVSGESVGFMEQSGKAFNSGEEKAAIIDNIGVSRYLACGRLL